MLLCHALGWRSWQEDCMIFCGLKLHIPGRSPAGVSTALPSWGLCCVFHPWFPFGKPYLVFYAVRNGQQVLPEGQGAGQPLHSALSSQESPS